MNESKTEMLFPPRLIPMLRDLRGTAWQELVDSVLAAESEPVRQMAFVLMMVRLDGCSTCHVDTYWAMRGCQACARSSVARFRGSDEELLAMYNQSLNEIQAYLNERQSEQHKAAV